MMQPTTPIDPAQRIDQTYGPNGLVEELVYNYPPDGDGTRRWVDEQGEHSEPVTGLPIPAPVASPAADTAQRLAAAQAVLAEAAQLTIVLPTDLQDILARTAEALEG